MLLQYVQYIHIYIYIYIRSPQTQAFPFGANFQGRIAGKTSTGFSIQTPVAVFIANRGPSTKVANWQTWWTGQGLEGFADGRMMDGHQMAAVLDRSLYGQYIKVPYIFKVG